MRLLRFIGMIAILIFIFFVLPINEWIAKPSGELTVSTMWEDTKDSVQQIDLKEIGDRMESTANRAKFLISNLMDDESSVQFQEMPKHEPTEQGHNNKPEIELTEADIQEFEYQVLELVNEERKAQGLKPLEFSVQVSEVARAKSHDMADSNYFDHQSPNYGSPFEMMQTFGVDYRAAGENIAMGQRSPEEVMNGWMNSEGHRKNIMHDQFTHLGVGYVEKNGTTYWTQMFVGR
uniref:CAP domain-containing protein n=1 Tax=uncultured Allobacillus sp. TaxID=1638025 RepID=UPI0025962103|nr:CAP domain-containing protein [uncultured Allobacillus sp.]